MDSYEQLRELVSAFPEIAKEQGEAACAVAFNKEINDIHKMRVLLSPEEEKTEKARFQKIMLPLVHESTFCGYVYDKPLGYAGDYITQEMIWTGRVLGGESRYRGSTPAGKLLNSITLDMENCIANERRVEILRNIICDNGPSIMSIGCGSCIELWQFPENVNSAVLVDQDQRTLNRAAEKINLLSRPSIRYIEANLMKFILRPREDLIASRTLVYLFGLFDYFSVSNSSRIIKKIWDYVAPGGLLVVTNAHPSNPTKTWMEWGGEWYLDYKDQNEVLSMVTGLPGTSSIDLEVDDFGIYQYALVRKV